LQRPRQAVKQVLRWLVVMALPKRQVVLRTDAGQHRHLLAAQPRYAATLSGGQAHVARFDKFATSAKKCRLWVGVGHRLNVTPG
jgi:hypothetical protein